MLPVHKLRHQRRFLWASSGLIGQAYFLHTAAALLSQKPFGVLLTGCFCATIGRVGVMCGTVLE